MDGSFTSPPTSILVVNGVQQANPEYYALLRLNQRVRSWIFTTFSSEVLSDIRDQPTSFHVYDKLMHRFMHPSMARALELKRMLTNIKKGDTQSMDAYLHEIKTIADNLATVNSPVPQSDLVHYTLLGLG